MERENKIFYDANELAALLGVSKGHAYKIIRQLNDELRKDGFLTLSGKVAIDYFQNRWFGYENKVG